ncbi:aminotransferase class V-fold PLP-dependent enzyme [Anderseniella sp. Alg231-50]|uniref:aminotransferase class V-fold PLP-dependent enzyme n=1 Tax=Anderseniella sp. Alg231-50 TaxID=1922226 RepID=UPI000D5513E1
MNEIYLNACSHGLPSADTVARMRAHLDLELELGPLAALQAVADELSDVRTRAEHLISASPGTVGLAATTFSSWLSIVARLPIAGKRLLVAPHEWGENIAALRVLADNAGGTVETLPELNLSAPDLAAWSACIDEDVAAVFTPYISSVAGLRYPVEAIGALPRPENTLVIVDGAQALGQTPIDVSQMGCDVLVATCRKWLRGPRGTAVLWIADPDRHGFSIKEVEPFDANIALRLGLGAAIKEATLQSVEKIEHRVQSLARHAHALALQDDVMPLGEAPPISGACSVYVPSQRRERLQNALNEAGIHIKWPDAGQDEPASETGKADHAIMRISPHVYNSTDDIDAVFDLLRAS